MDYNSESSFVERGNNVRGENFNSSGEAHLEITFDLWYPSFLLRHSTRDVADSTLLTGLSTIEKWSRSGTFVTLHELEREPKNTRTKLLE